MNRNEPVITDECMKTMFESQYLNVYDLQYMEGRHYYNATRRKREDTAVLKSEEEYLHMIPDAVSCFVIVKGSEDKLLLAKEYRYPTGHFILGVPAGLIDRADIEIKPDPEQTRTEALIKAAKRELKEETGLTVSDVSVVNPLVFSSPGLTDESNALVKVTISEEDLKELTQSGAEASEVFDGFELIDRKLAEKLIKDGVDDEGHSYSVYTWMALVFFLSKL